MASLTRPPKGLIIVGVSLYNEIIAEWFASRSDVALAGYASNRITETFAGAPINIGNTEKLTPIADCKAVVNVAVAIGENSLCHQGAYQTGP